MPELQQNWHWLLWAVLIGVSFLVIRAMTRVEPVRFTSIGRLADRAHLRMWHALADAAKGDWLVLPNVSLNRLMKLAEPNRLPKKIAARQGDRLKTAQVDFVILDPTHGTPQAAVVLIPTFEDDDDPDTRLKEAQHHADAIGELLAHVAIPLWVIGQAVHYDTKELRGRLDGLHSKAA